MKNKNQTSNSISSIQICEKKNTIDIQKDYTLPDYLPEIRRFLLTTAEIPPSDFQSSEQKIDFYGDIKYTLFYIGSDNQIYSTVLENQYNFSCQTDNKEKSINYQDITVCNSENIDAIQTKVLAPRKVNIRTKLSFNTKCYAKMNIENSVLLSSLETKEEKALEMLILCGKSELLSAHDFISLDRGIDTTRIVDIKAEALVENISNFDTYIDVSGNIYYDILFYNEEMGDFPISFSRIISFSEKVELPNIDSSFDLCAKPYINSQNFDIEEDGINVEIFYGFKFDIRKNQEFSYIKDAYSTENMSSVTYSPTKIQKNCALVSKNYTLNDSIALKSIPLDNDARIIYAFSGTQNVDSTIDNSKLIIGGNCLYSIIYYLNSEYSIVNFTLPFKYSFDIPCNDSDIVASSKANIITSKLKTDGKKLDISSEISICYSVTSLSTIDLIKDITIGDKLEKKNGECIIYFPDKNDTLWNIAKQYNEKIQSIKDKNNLQSEENIDNKFLFI